MAAVAPINTHMLSPLSFLKSDEGSEVGVAPLLDPQNQSQAIKQTDFCISTSNFQLQTTKEGRGEKRKLSVETDISQATEHLQIPSPIIPH